MSFTDPEPLTGIGLYEVGQELGEVKISELFVAALDFCHPTVQSKTVADPSGLSPTDGQKWIVASSPVGVWTGHTDDIAVWRDGWYFFTPEHGHLATNKADKKLYVFNSAGAWQQVPGTTAWT